MIKTNSVNRKPIITLFEYAHNKDKQRTEVGKVKLVKQQESAKSSSKWTYGLDTLIHFNDSFNLSSIKPNQSKASHTTKPISRYEQLIAQAKEDVQRLKSRRIQSEQEWKRQRHLEQENDKQNQSVADSEVTPYDLTQSYFPKTFQNKGLGGQDRDHLAQQIRRQITKSNLMLMVVKIKRIFVSKFISDLRIANQIENLQAERNKKITREVFVSWRQLANSCQERQNIRMAIAARIKQRRAQKEDQQYLASILKN